MKKETTRKRCLQCGHEFTYRERLQSTYRLFWRMYCKECGARYKVLTKYSLAVAILMALPVAFGPSLYDYMGWGVWNVLIFIIVYSVFLTLLTLFVIPILPVKWDSAEENDNPNSENLQ